VCVCVCVCVRACARACVRARVESKLLHNFTHSFVKHTGLPILVFACGTVYKAVAQDMIVDAMISTHSIRGRASESFHSVFGNWTFCKQNRKNPSSIRCMKLTLCLDKLKVLHIKTLTLSNLGQIGKVSHKRYHGNRKNAGEASIIFQQHKNIQVSI